MPRQFGGLGRDGGMAEYMLVPDGRSFEALSQERDNLIMGLLELLSHRRKTKSLAPRGHAADGS